MCICTRLLIVAAPIVFTRCATSSTRNTTSRRDGMVLSASTCCCAWDGEMVVMTMMRRFSPRSKIVALDHIATYRWPKSRGGIGT